MLPGDDLYTQIDRGIRLWDKLLLCCSTAALTSWWVDHEIDLAFEKERDLMRTRGEKVLTLIPLRIPHQSWIMAILCDVVGSSCHRGY
jgi:hypothetical protein